jgi:peptidyl-prolyl cis-trans isomerase D
VYNLAALAPSKGAPYNKPEHRFMLDSLRASKGGLITWLFLGAIIIVFVISFGPGSFTTGSAGCGGAPTYAAQVNGEAIPAADWERQVRFALARQRQGLQDYIARLEEQLPTAGPNAPIVQMQLDYARRQLEESNTVTSEIAKQVLTAMIERELVVQEAERRGIVVTSGELLRVIQADPAFQENGQFVKEAYLDAVRREYGSPAKYEALLRSDHLFQKMWAALDATVKLSDAEVRQAWAAAADRASLAFVLFPSVAAAEEVKPSDADVQAFAQKEGARIEAFYKENAARFDQKKKVRVRHVLARVGEGEDDAEARKKVELAAERVKKGEDFTKVAAELSDDPNTKDRGGDLGLISEGLADPAFEKAALALERGQVSEPVRSASGWHLIRVDEVIPGKQVPLEAARLEIARELLTKDRAAALARERAQAALEAARKGKSLEELFPPAVGDKKSVTLGGQPIVPQETGPFASGAPFLPKIGAAPELARDALAANAGDVLPRVYETPAGAVVAVVKTRERPDEKAFEMQREGVAQRLRNEKEAQLQQSWLAELRERATIVENEALFAPASEG